MTRKIHNNTGDPADDCCRRPGCNHTRKKHGGENGGRLGFHACTALNYDPFGPATPCACEAFVEPLPEKPAPTIPDRIEMHLTWEGVPPAIGEFLVTPSKQTRFAYRVIDVYEVKRRDPQATPKFEIGALRIPLKELPAGATCHTFRWNPRAKKTLKRGITAEGSGWSSKED